MRETLLLDVPRRQVVFTISKMLRGLLQVQAPAPGDLCRCAFRALTRYFEVLTGSAVAPGVIAAIQTFGDRINLHPHLYFLVTEAGVFHKIPRIDDSRLAEIFAREVLAMLVRKVIIRYYGLYANAHRGKVKKASLVPLALRRRGGAEARPLQGLGGHDPEGL